MGVMESLDLSSKRGVPFAIEGEIDHWREGFIGVEHICLLPGEYSSRIGVQPHTKRSGVIGAIAPMGEYDLWGSPE